MHPKLLIFDLDGTLIYSIKDLCQACNYALKQLNLEQLPLSHYKKLVGNGIMRLIQKALPEKLRDDILIIEQMKKHFTDYYNQHLFDYSYPYDGIVETLTYLKNNNFFLAIASNKYQSATKQIADHFFSSIFNIVLGERENVQRKPNPIIINDIIADLSFNKVDSIFMIGDSPIDIQTAKNANIASIACTWGFVNKTDLEKEAPDFLIDHPKDIISIVKTS